MGLLGNGFDDPQSAAIMALASGLMKRDFAGGLLGANNAYSESKQNALKQKYMDLQGQNLLSEIDTRKAAMAQAQQKALDDRQFLGIGGGGGVPGAQGAPGAAPAGGPPGVGSPQPDAGGGAAGGFTAQQISQRYGIPLEAVQTDFRFNGGKKIAELIDSRTKPNWQNINGNLVNTNASGFQGGIQGGINAGADGRVTAWQPDGKGGVVVGAPQGALDTYGAFRQVDEAAKAGSDLIQVLDENGKPVWRTRSQGIAASGGGAPAPQATPPNPFGPRLPKPEPSTGHFQGDPRDVAMAIGQIQDPQQRSNVQAAFEAVMRQTGGKLPPVGGPMAAGLSPAEKNAGEAGGKINESWIKSSYEPTLALGTSARDLADTIQVTRQAMTNMGKTGWGTQAQATAAGVLSGLGIATGNAKLFAANAELFQNKAMERLQSTLNAATGPQTEGDADRASKTYASVQNTPQANAYILDFAEAKAMRDQMKARFYQQAQPIAQKKGDLSEVDREWALRAPSIFSLPSMQKWAGGIK